MLLPRVVSDVFIICCESGTIKHDYQLRLTHHQNLEKLVKSEVVALSQTRQSMSYDIIVKSGLLFRSPQVSVSNSQIEQIGSKSKVFLSYHLLRTILSLRCLSNTLVPPASTVPLDFTSCYYQSSLLSFTSIAQIFQSGQSQHCSTDVCFYTYNTFYVDP